MEQRIQCEMRESLRVSTHSRPSTSLKNLHSRHQTEHWIAMLLLRVFINSCTVQGVILPHRKQRSSLTNCLMLSMWIRTVSLIFQNSQRVFPSYAVGAVTTKCAQLSISTTTTAMVTLRWMRLLGIWLLYFVFCTRLQNQLENLSQSARKSWVQWLLRSAFKKQIWIEMEEYPTKSFVHGTLNPVKCWKLSTLWKHTLPLQNQAVSLWMQTWRMMEMKICWMLMVTW